MSESILLAVAPVPLWPTDNGYSLRVTSVLEELVKLWDTILVAPESEASADKTSSLNLLDFVPVAGGGRFATMPWQLDIEALRRPVDHVLSKVRPSAALLWSGTEVLGFDEFPPAVADRIDSATLAAVRMRPGLLSLRKRLRMGVRAALYERRVVRSMSATIVVGDADARTLKRISGRDSIHVVPNGVELGPPPQASWESSQPTVMFTGVLSFRPNADAAIDFARNVWPLVRAAVPSARFAVVGRDPGENVWELADLPGVDVLADVPDLRSELRRAWVAVAPMRSGSGIKNKILESWACGKPVVLSSLAANGLAPGYEKASVTADNPSRVAAEVTSLLQDSVRRESLGRAGYALVAEHHSWSGAASRVSNLLHAAEADEEWSAPTGSTEPAVS